MYQYIRWYYVIWDTACEKKWRNTILQACKDMSPAWKEQKKKREALCKPFIVYLFLYWCILLAIFTLKVCNNLHLLLLRVFGQDDRLENKKHSLALMHAGISFPYNY